MIEGSTVIMNEAYIAELTRHRDICKKKLDKETFPKIREELTERYNRYDNMLNQALDFQDTIVEVINIDIPKLTSIRTMSGLVLPLKNVQVL